MYGRQTLKIMQSPKKALDMHIYVFWVVEFQFVNTVFPRIVSAETILF